MADKQNQKPISAPGQKEHAQKNRPGIKIRKLFSGLSSTVKCSLLLALTAIAVYANTLLNDYAYDDPVMMSQNALVKQGIKGIPELLLTPHMRGFLAIPNDVYRPLSLVMFAVEYQVFGFNPAAGHFFNILVFALCVVLLFLVLDKLLYHKKTSVAFIAALIFTVHPVHTEVVANIKSRDELVCFLFAFMSLWLFMSYMAKGKPGTLLGGAFVLYLSYLSKETSIAFAGIIPFIFFFYYNDNRKRAIHITVATSVITAVFLIVRIVILNKYKANIPTPTEFIDNSLTAAPSAASYIATLVTILGKYLKLMVIPYPLSCDYAYNSIPFSGLSDPYFWLSVIAYSFIIYIAISRWIKKQNDPWAFAIIFYLATIFLFSNIPLLIAGQFAERFVFFASAGFCFAVGLAADKWLIKGDAANNWPFLKNTKLLAALVPVLLIFSSLTVARNTDWKNSDILFSKDVEKSPNDSRLHHHLGSAFDARAQAETDTLERLRLEEEVISHYRRSLEIYPGYRMAAGDLANVYNRKKVYDSAEKYFLKAIALNSLDVIAINNLGSLYYNVEKFDKALVYFRKGLQLAPDIKFAHLNIANSFKKLKEYDSSIKYNRNVLNIDPKYMDARKQLVEVFDSLGNFDSAEYHYKQIAILLPGNPDVTNDIGIFYFNKKMYDQAIEQFKKTIRLDSNYINAYANMGVSLFLTNRYEEAVQAFNKELALDPYNGQDIPYLALAYQKMGKMDLALKYEAIVKQFNPGFKLP